MDSIVTINLSINGSTVTDFGGSLIRGETEHALSDVVTLSGNVITFNKPFTQIHIQPDKTVGMTFGVTATAGNAFLVGPYGRSINNIDHSKVSFISAETVVVSLLAVLRS